VSSTGLHLQASETERWPSGLRCTPGTRVYASTVSSNLTLSASHLTCDSGVIAGSCATRNRKPRQVRKEAAVVKLLVCCRGAWLSFFLGSAFAGSPASFPLFKLSLSSILRQRFCRNRRNFDSDAADPWNISKSQWRRPVFLLLRVYQIFLTTIT
jgi:hypothetical protein